MPRIRSTRSKTGASYVKKTLGGTKRKSRNFSKDVGVPSLARSRKKGNARSR